MVPGDLTPKAAAGLPLLRPPFAVSRVKATVLSDASAEPLVLGLLPVFAAATGISAEDARQLHAVVAGLVR